MMTTTSSIFGCRVKPRLLCSTLSKSHKSQAFHYSFRQSYPDLNIVKNIAKLFLNKLIKDDHPLTGLQQLAWQLLEENIISSVDNLITATSTTDISSSLDWSVMLLPIVLAPLNYTRKLGRQTNSSQN